MTGPAYPIRLIYSSEEGGQISWRYFWWNMYFKNYNRIGKKLYPLVNKPIISLSHEFQLYKACVRQFVTYAYVSLSRMSSCVTWIDFSWYEINSPASQTLLDGTDVTLTCIAIVAYDMWTLLRSCNTVLQKWRFSFKPFGGSCSKLSYPIRGD